MGKTKCLISLLLCIAMLLSLCACGSQTPAVPEPTEPPVTEPPVSQQYTQAAQPLRDAKDLSLELKITKTIVTEVETMELINSFSKAHRTITAKSAAVV